MRPRSLIIFKNDVVVSRETYSKFDNHGDKIRRGEVKRLSEKSLKRLAFVAANTSVDFTGMVTLTYPSSFETDGKEVKRHLREWLQVQKRNGMQEYLWFLEFQARGAPHFHVLFTGKLYKNLVSGAWYEIVGSGDVKHYRAGTRVESIRVKDGGKRYAVKYATKAYQKNVPEYYSNVGRFWGHSKGVRPVPVGVVTPDMIELDKVLIGWEYLEKAEDKLSYLRVLYGAAATVIDNVPGCVIES